ncbi:putative uncharacterized protein [Clostridium sp. CAG:470]|jgi:copper amine oxidase N-terminal domain|nr:MAG: hypothetical protein BHW03_06635 [Clostridium sp. 28_17]CDE14254.1 putative uncharacterized protein [Clostridium sp. CAG:470]
MNLIDESVDYKKKDNSKKIARIILIFIALIIIAIISVLGVLMYIKNKELKLYIDGNVNDKVKNMMEVDEDGTVYFPVKDIASYLGYQSYNGEYTDKSEDANKCYVQNDNEIANFVLNSNKIYKLALENSDGNYNYYYANKPVKAINGKLYISSDALANAFNLSFTYDTDSNRVYIYTMPYLIESYSAKVLDYGYDSISDNFINQKAVLNSMLVVTKNQGKSYAVIDLKGNAIIEAKYDNIEYLENTGDFLVTSNNKVGIISSKRETKVQLLYDSLELVDSDSGLFIAKKDNKYGIIDSKGNIKVYIEYDQIGIDNTKFEKNNIKNKYLLDNGMIPAKKDKYWGAFDKNGKTVLNFEYDSFGYTATSNREAINLLIIPDYNLMVVCQNKKYALVSSTGDMVIRPVLDDVYMTISSGKKYYYMNVSDRKIDIIEFLDEQSPNITKNSSDETNNNTTSENKSEENTSTETNN